MLETPYVIPYFIMLIGLPASGKSTWIANSGYENYVLISSDNIIEQEAIKLSKTYTEIFKDTIKDAEIIAKYQFKEAIEEKYNIIWDQTNLSVKKRKGILQQLPAEYFK